LAMPKPPSKRGTRRWRCSAGRSAEDIEHSGADVTRIVAR
jgi:hypothetical protein